MPLENDQLLTSPEGLAKADWETLMRLRKAIPPEDPRQASIAPYEHRAWAREQVAGNPLLAPVYAALVPGYQLAKLVKSFTPGQTAPSMNQLSHGMTGIAEGVQQWLDARRRTTG